MPKAPAAAPDKDVPMKSDFLARLLRTPAPMRLRAYPAGGSVRSSLPAAALRQVLVPADGNPGDAPDLHDPSRPLPAKPGGRRVRGAFAGLRPVRSRRPLAEVLRLLGEGRRSLEGATAEQVREASAEAKRAVDVRLLGLVDRQEAPQLPAKQEDVEESFERGTLRGLFDQLRGNFGKGDGNV